NGVRVDDFAGRIDSRRRRDAGAAAAHTMGALAAFGVLSALLARIVVADLERHERNVPQHFAGIEVERGETATRAWLIGVRCDADEYAVVGDGRRSPVVIRWRLALERHGERTLPQQLAGERIETRHGCARLSHPQATGRGQT